jgi:SAM-dependent methyltransferase
MPADVEASYSHRAAEYTKNLGSMTGVHPSDVQLVSAWAEHIDGPLLDAGCGPGHWTGYLAERGSDARGVDQVSSFIDHARKTYPQVPFEVGSIDALTDASGSIGGVLAWYSLIHHEPGIIHLPLAEFARVLRPGGGLLLGFFIGSAVEAFDHAIVTAYRWSAEALSEELRRAGFEVIETHTRTGFRSKPRPHGAILARLVSHR